jgi:chemosensory pili system protein ChpA (sensor histidine kinase/response regulator)
MTKLILLVDDKVDLRRNLAEALSFEGFDVLQASDGLEAMSILQSVKPSLIVTDVLMPILDGFDLIRNIRSDESLASVRILVFSAMPEEENRKKAFDLGANEYINKPSTLEEFLNVAIKLAN